MKRWFVLAITAVFIAALVIYGLSYDSGHVRIIFGHWLIETNVWVLIAANLALLATLFLIGFLIKSLRSGTGGLIHWARVRPKKRANEHAQRGLLSFLEGDWPTAQKLLTRSATHSRMPIVNLLAAANAASQLGEHKESSKLLRQAHALVGGSELAASLTQARLHVENERYEAALAVLVRLRKNHPRHPYVAKLLVKVYTELEDWEQLVHCFEDETAATLDLEKDFECKVWSMLFANHAAKLRGEGSAEQVADGLSELWKRVPNKLRYDEKVIYAYTRELISLGLDRDAEVIIRKVLDKSWSENLVDAYGITRGKDRTEQLLHAESWLKARPNSPRLLLALGRLCLRCELWGKAAEYFEASQKQQASLEACAELYRLYLHLKKPEKQLDQLLIALMQHIHLPELPQPR